MQLEESTWPGKGENVAGEDRQKQVRGCDSTLRKKTKKFPEYVLFTLVYVYLFLFLFQS